MRENARVAVVGATGYAGMELAKILLGHPLTPRPTFFLRGEHADVKCLSQLMPQLRGCGEAPCRPFSANSVTKSGAQAVFLATPHEASLEVVSELLAAGLRVIDLSGAFRFRDGDTFEKWYGAPPASAHILNDAVYGLPEFYGGDLPSARVVANPGCYATSVILALKPLAESGWIDGSAMVVCDCKSGVSGAGKEPKRETHYVEVNENFRAYNVHKHRHTPEIAAHTGLALDEIFFTTHLLPLERGILSTIYVRLAERHSPEEVSALFGEYYDSQPLMRMHSPGQLPELRHVAHTNFCDIGFSLHEDGRRLVVVSCLDNLGKGAAGQAVQNFNIMMGYPQTTGLI
jgi:N-acetyl-gamma-glutamyl-phosphate reductase